MIFLFIITVLVKLAAQLATMFYKVNEIESNHFNFRFFLHIEFLSSRCGCDECVTASEKDSLCHSQSRINAYKALSASSLIALSSRDPILTSFELSWELRRLSRMETEFRQDYNVSRK